MKNSRLIRWLVVLAAISLLLASCATTPAAPAVATLTPVPTGAAAQSSSTGAGMTITDDAQRTVVVPSQAQRIVSLAPSTTEIAFALGLGPRLVAVDKFSDFPAEAKDLAKVNTSPLNLEEIVALKPDLVLAASITNRDDVKKMADLNLTVLVVGAMNTTFDNVLGDISMVGKATGTLAAAKSVTDAMTVKLNAVKAQVAKASSKPRVYWELDATDPSKPYTPGPGSFIDEIIALDGGTNAAANAKAPFAQINAEEVIAANPDVIILSDFAYGTTVESVKSRKGWSAVNAVKNDRVYPIDDNLVSRPGPRLAEGIEAAAKLIHPELFK